MHPPQSAHLCYQSILPTPTRCSSFNSLIQRTPFPKKVQSGEERSSCFLTLFLNHYSFIHLKTPPASTFLAIGAPNLCLASLISCHLSPYWYFLLISGKCTWFRTIFVSKFHAATIQAELTIHVVAFFNALVFIALFIHYSMYLFIQKIYILTSPGGSATYKIDKISNLKELT